MCGIFGWDLKRSKVSNKQRLVLSTALSMQNDVRGGDSWGFFSPETGNAKRGLDYAAPKSYEISTNKVVGVHTRRATTGAKTVENAHPFDIGNIIGAHNGVVFNHDELLKKYDRKFEVDSMHIFAHLNDPELKFGEISGYGAVWFVRKNEPKRIYLCRISSSGDLTVSGIGKCEKDDGSDVEGVIWSSDKSHLHKALMAANIQAFDYKIEAHQLYYIENSALFVVKDTKLEVGSARSSYGWPEAGDFEYAHGYNQNWHRRSFNSASNVINMLEDSKYSDEDLKTRPQNPSFGSIWVLASGDMLVYSGTKFISSSSFLKEFPNSKYAQEIEEMELDLVLADAAEEEDAVVEDGYEGFPTQEQWEKMTDEQQFKLMSELDFNDADKLEQVLKLNDNQKEAT